MGRRDIKGHISCRKENIIIALLLAINLCVSFSNMTRLKLINRIDFNNVNPRACNKSFTKRKGYQPYAALARRIVF